MFVHSILVRLKGWRWPHNPGITAAEILTSAFFYNPPGLRPIIFCHIFCADVAHALSTCWLRTHHAVLSQLQGGASIGLPARC